jgi:hypothetical protein
MDAVEPKRRSGMKIVCALKGKEPAQMRALPDGRVIVVQADAAPIIINHDGSVEELSAAPETQKSD